MRRRVAANVSARRSSQHRGREGPDLTHVIVFQRAESLRQLLKLCLGYKICGVPVVAVSKHARSPRALARDAYGFERGDPRGVVPFFVEGDIEVGRDLLLRELRGRDPQHRHLDQPPVSRDGDGSSASCAAANLRMVPLLPLANLHGDLPGTRRGHRGGTRRAVRRPGGVATGRLHERPREFPRLGCVEDHRHLIRALVHEPRG